MYEDSIKGLADHRSYEFINCSSPAHSGIVLKEIFGRAVGNVYAVTRQLSSDVYGRKEVKDAIKHFLQKDECALQIILRTDAKYEQSLSRGGNNSFLADLKEYKDKISFFSADISEYEDVLIAKTAENDYMLWVRLHLDDYVGTACFRSVNNGAQDLFNSYEKKSKGFEKIEIKEGKKVIFI